MNLKQYIKESRKKYPKTYAKIDKQWDVKMMDDVMEFVFSLSDNIYAKVPKGKPLFNGGAIEEKVWKLLKKARRLT